MAYIKVFNIVQFRNIKALKLKKLAQINLITGNNGAGKTSILEAIYYSNRVKSFKTIDAYKIIAAGYDNFSLYTEICDKKKTSTIGIKRDKVKKKITIMLNDKLCKTVSSITHLLPIQILDTNFILKQIINKKARISILDWCLFYSPEHQSFYKTWLDANKIIKYRNHLLKKNLNKAEIVVWNKKLSELSHEIDNYRKSIYLKYKSYLDGFLADLLPEYKFEYGYNRGWEKELNYLKCLENNLLKDIKYRYTTDGLHKADINFHVILQENVKINIVDGLSRGELKRYIIAIKLAQIIFLKKECDRESILLIDDLIAELDEQSICLILKTLRDLKIQVFISIIDLELLNNSVVISKMRLNNNIKTFHVEHGELITEK